MEFKVSPIKDQVALLLKEKMCILGVFLEPGLVLDKQVAAVVRNAFYQVGLVS